MTKPAKYGLAALALAAVAIFPALQATASSVDTPTVAMEYASVGDGETPFFRVGDAWDITYNVTCKSSLSNAPDRDARFSLYVAKDQNEPEKIADAESVDVQGAGQASWTRTVSKATSGSYRLAVDVTRVSPFAGASRCSWDVKITHTAPAFPDVFTPSSQLLKVGVDIRPGVYSANKYCAGQSYRYRDDSGTPESVIWWAIGKHRLVDVKATDAYVRFTPDTDSRCRWHWGLADTDVVKWEGRLFSGGNPPDNP